MSLAVGIDIGGTKIAAGVVDDNGEIIDSGRVKTPRVGIGSVQSAVVELVQELQSKHDIEAVGVGAAGFVNESRSAVLLAPNLGWKDIPLKENLESRLNLRVVIENDANVAAWGEFKYGAGRGLSDMVCITVGTGIGGGLVLGGQLFRGGHGVAAEIGHLCVEPGGRLCGCGNRGCWEQYASGNALVREARYLASERRSEAARLLALGDGTPEGVTGAHVTEAAQAGDPVALGAFDSVARWLGVGMADLTAVLDPGVFVIGGGVSEAGDLLLGAVKRAYKDSVSGNDVRPIAEVRLAELGNKAGVVGAADLTRVD
ncbi:MAG: ROK family glucokinase [Candidatus Nanopelagicales bacterium]